MTNFEAAPFQLARQPAQSAPGPLQPRHRVAGGFVCQQSFQGQQVRQRPRLRLLDKLTRQPNRLLERSDRFLVHLGCRQQIRVFVVTAPQLAEQFLQPRPRLLVGAGKAGFGIDDQGQLAGEIVDDGDFFVTSTPAGHSRT